MESYFGSGIRDLFGVFLFKIIPVSPNVDEWLWVIVGDIPPAYIVTDFAQNPTSALRCYIAEMRRWVLAAERGASLSGIIPVNAPATKEYAKMLKGRLGFIESEFLNQKSKGGRSKKRSCKH